MQLSSFEQAQDVLRNLQENGRGRKSGWTLSKALQHCSQSIEYSVEGFPKVKGRVFQSTVGSSLKGLILKRGVMNHPLNAGIPGAADVREELAVEDAKNRLKNAIQKFQNTDAGRLSPHFVFGNVQKDDYQRLHLMHLSDHLGEFIENDETQFADVFQLTYPEIGKSAKRISKHPLVLDAKDHPEAAASMDAFRAWVKKDIAKFQQRLLDHGMILFRGFPVQNAEDFRSITQIASSDERIFSYDGGISPRTEVAEKVFTASNVPWYNKITLHSELPYLKECPTKLAFFCETPAGWSGETPLAYTRDVLRDIPADVVERMEKKGLLYVRELSPATPAMKRLAKINPMFITATWQGSFKTESREKVEEVCREWGFQYKWEPNGKLRTWTHVPALRAHPITGEKTWFNQVHTFFLHWRNMGKGFVHLVGLYRKLSTDEFDIYYSDGSRIADSDKLAIMDALDGNTFQFSWQKGDVMLVDNYQLMHGRNPYFGDRRVLVSIIG